MEKRSAHSWHSECVRQLDAYMRCLISEVACKRRKSVVEGYVLCDSPVLELLEPSGLHGVQLGRRGKCHLEDALREG